jgi:chromosomal replication initiator protein
MQSELSPVWDRILETLRQWVNHQTYQTWFAQTEFLSIDDDSLDLQGPNQFFVDWLTEHHLETIRSAAVRVLGRTLAVRVRVSANGHHGAAALDGRPTMVVPAPIKRVEAPAARTPRETGLNPRYRFSSFVVGDNNRLAHAAAQAVADQPAHSYNPLFLYGGVGLGKTHLMQAIGNAVLETMPSAVVHYTSAENFMNELIQAIRTGRTYEFKGRYRTVDVLLIDDIQFLAGKESTQQEFFHTFNALYDANKQIVVSSDRPPKEIPTLEERLRSRFEWGLITDLQAPNLETRIAILKKKLEKEDTVIPDDVLVFIAESVTSNIRELEGALIRLLAFAGLTGNDINLDTAKQVVETFVNRHAAARRQLTLGEIITAVAAYYDISIDLLRSKLRTKPVAHARQVAMYFCRELTGASLSQIGRKFGNRDHTTVHHAWQKISELEQTDLELRHELGEIGRAFNQDTSPA